MTTTEHRPRLDRHGSCLGEGNLAADSLPPLDDEHAAGNRPYSALVERGSNHVNHMTNVNRSLPPRNVEGYFIWVRGGNTGDDLIRRGCLKFLRDSGIDVWESDGSIEAAALAGDDAYLDAALSRFQGFIFFTGGGNVGIYPDNGHVRERVSAVARSASGTLLFSQSARAVEASLVSERTSVWSRDRGSLKILRDAGVHATLVPDCAFYLDTEVPKRPTGTGLFQVLREPGRDDERVDHGLGLPEAKRGDPTYNLPVDEVIRALSPYRVILSDRLHGAIVALMLRKRTAILPIGYHKNRSFYETWLSGDRAIAYVDDRAGLERFIAGEEIPELDLHALFIDHARPAFRSFLDAASRRAARLAPAAADVFSPRHQQRLVSITCVRDEEDIVEAFVRHTATLVDELIVLDNGSTDQTPRILDELKAEGLPLRLLSDDSIGYWQWKRTSNLMNLAVQQCDAGWVLPLDVDEFVIAADPASLRAALSKEAGPVRVRWITYVPHRSDDPADRNPCTRIQHRVSDEELWHKVFVPRAVAARNDAMLAQGSHDVEINGMRCAPVDLDGVHLAHLPVRSATQFATKIAVSQLQLLAMHDRNPGWLFHHRRFYDLLKSDEYTFAESCSEAALEYATRSEEGMRACAVHDPFPYAGGPLRYTDRRHGSTTLRAVLQYGEQLASAHALAVQKLRALEAHNANVVRQTEHLRKDGQALHRAVQTPERSVAAFENEVQRTKAESDRLSQERAYRIAASARALWHLLRSGARADFAGASHQLAILRRTIRKVPRA